MRNMREEDSVLYSKTMTKLRSQRGASITIALLLFLVCTVIGSVVLAAGTASSGRVSDLARMDRRYYAVASAAQLLARELSGKEVVYEKTGSVTTINGEDVKDAESVGAMSYLSRQAAHYLNSGSVESSTENLVLEFRNTTDETSNVTSTIYVTSTLDNSGKLKLVVSDYLNSIDSTDSGYRLTLTMIPTISDLGEWSEKIGDTDTTTSRHKISWTADSIR